MTLVLSPSVVTFHSVLFRLLRIGVVFSELKSSGSSKFESNMVHPNLSRMFSTNFKSDVSLD